MGRKTVEQPEVEQEPDCLLGAQWDGRELEPRASVGWEKPVQART